MCRTATVIPVHPPKFGYAMEAVKTWNKYSNNDLYFIFSYPDDEVLFRKNIEGQYNTLVLPQELVHYKNPITVKKLWGVSQLIDAYDYVGVFDAEIKIVKPFNTDEIYPEIFQTKELKCNACMPSVDGGAVVKNNSLTMGIAGNENLIRETENFKWYWWFNEICVYESATFDEFMTFLKNSGGLEIYYNEYWCFDYLLYGIWLLAFKNFKTKKFFPDKKFGFGAIEHNQFNVGNISDEFKSYMDSNMHPERHDHIKVQFHMDRYIDPKDFVSPA